MTDQRSAELSQSLMRVRGRIEAACRAADRSAEEVTLVAVTKTYPADDVRRLVELGVQDIGENRDQEAARKAEECAGIDVTWHFVGQLQSNKARSVVGYAQVVHSIDRGSLIDALASAAHDAGRRVECLVQVSLDMQPGRGGARPEDVSMLAEQIARAEFLRVRGVMAVAPLGTDPDAAFSRLEDVAARLRDEHPDATWVSAGMSGDLDEAIHHGATHVRVGAALLGQRPLLR